MKYHPFLVTTIVSASIVGSALLPLSASAFTIHPVFQASGAVRASTTVGAGVGVSASTSASLRREVGGGSSANRNYHPGRATYSNRTEGGIRVTASQGGEAALHIREAAVRIEASINRRLALLQEFSVRINNVHMSSVNKTALRASLADQMTALVHLKENISRDTATSSLRAQLQTAVGIYHAFALIVPQSAIVAAADRVTQISSQMQEFSGKLAARIQVAESAGANVSALVSARADFDAKVAAARTQAAAAVAEANTVNTHATTQDAFRSGRAALKDARSKIQAARQDLIAARQDAGLIVSSLVRLGNTSVTASSSVSAQTR